MKSSVPDDRDGTGGMSNSSEPRTSREIRVQKQTRGTESARQKLRVFRSPQPSSGRPSALYKEQSRDVEDAITFLDEFQRFAHLSDDNLATRRRAFDHIGSFLSWCQEHDTSVARLTSEQLWQMLVEWAQENGWIKSTLERASWEVRNFIGYVCRARKIDDRILRDAASFRLPAVRSGNGRRGGHGLTADQLDEFTELGKRSTEISPHPLREWMHVELFHCGRLSSLRPGELCLVRMHDYDPATGVISVPSTDEARFIEEQGGAQMSVDGIAKTGAKHIKLTASGRERWNSVYYFRLKQMLATEYETIFSLFNETSTARGTVFDRVRPMTEVAMREWLARLSRRRCDRDEPLASGRARTTWHDQRGYLSPSNRLIFYDVRHTAACYFLIANDWNIRFVQSQIMHHKRVDMTEEYLKAAEGIKARMSSEQMARCLDEYLHPDANVQLLKEQARGNQAERMIEDLRNELGQQRALNASLQKLLHELPQALNNFHTNNQQ